MFATGRYLDRIDIATETYRFVERIVVLDSDHIDTLLAIPIWPAEPPPRFHAAHAGIAALVTVHSEAVWPAWIGRRDAIRPNGRTALSVEMPIPAG